VGLDCKQSPRSYIQIPHDHIRSAGFVLWFKQLLNEPPFGIIPFVWKNRALFVNACGHMDRICPRARRLGDGGALTVLQFAPLVQLRPVPGFCA
jgi:hypothetical protein